MPRGWGEALILICIGMAMTATIVTGLKAVVCNSKSQCGLGSRCDKITRMCVCRSANDTLKRRDGIPFAVFYCLVEGVTVCGDNLCGHRAECDGEGKKCACLFDNKDQLTKVSDSSPSVWFCLESCTRVNSTCPKNTTCQDPDRDGKYRCQCSQTATLSSIGQCLDNRSPSTTSSPNNGHDAVTDNRSASTTSSPNNGQDAVTDEDDSPTLVIGLVAGIGGTVLLVLVLVGVVVVSRRRKRSREDNSGKFSLRKPSASRDPSNDHIYNSVVDPPGTSGPGGKDNPTGPKVVSENNSRSRAYEEVDDFAIPLDTEVIQKKDKTEQKNFNRLYANPTISVNKEQERNNLNGVGSLPNNYNTLYQLTPTNGSEGSLQLSITGSGKTGGPHGAGEYATTYSVVGAKGGNNPASHAAARSEYDELKLPRV